MTEIENVLKFDSSEACKGKKAGLGRVVGLQDDAALKITKTQNFMFRNIILFEDMTNASVLSEKTTFNQFTKILYIITYVYMF